MVVARPQPRERVTRPRVAVVLLAAGASSRMRGRDKLLETIDGAPLLDEDMAQRYAREAELRVPEDVALVGADDDQLECELISPPLSSVMMPWRA